MGRVSKDVEQLIIFTLRVRTEIGASTVETEWSFLKQVELSYDSGFLILEMYVG